MNNHERLTSEHTRTVYSSMPEEAEIPFLLQALIDAGIDYSYCEDELTLRLLPSQNHEWLVIKETYDLRITL